MITKYIIAGNIEQFRVWHQKNHINESIKVVNVYDVSYLKGVHKPTGVLIGTWYLRKDIVNILDQLATSEAINKDQYYSLLSIVAEHITQEQFIVKVTS